MARRVPVLAAARERRRERRRSNPARSLFEDVAQLGCERSHMPMLRVDMTGEQIPPVRQKIIGASHYEPF
ncbi:MAG: hypothetical protein ACRES0_09190, partial [Pseudomonas sp.]